MGSSSALIESPASWWDSLAENFLPYLTIYAEEWDSLVEEFLRHLAMTCFAVVLALIIAVPLGIFITRSKKVSSVVIGIANVMQSIPCMALLAMGIPFLGVGETLAIFMVFVYAFLPILKNTYTGISSIYPVSLEVARGIGRHHDHRRFRRSQRTGLVHYAGYELPQLSYDCHGGGRLRCDGPHSGLPPGPRGTGPHQRGAAASGPDQKPQQSCPDPPQGSGRRAVLCPGRCLRGILCRHHCLSLSGLIS